METLKEDFKRPNLEKAKNYALSKGFCVKNKETGKWEQLDYCCSTKEFGRFGSGI